ncbi:von Willebrand factor D and EGF domain-containing protein-like [Aplysia californica]|uniref:von Willebrand factor D and EGF domain-containing protein-like n=1 Tax=Aplysia californica TaxID=6500 RepID=A0ABM1W0V0_APLCA|nr:von Willebrand factor D and EGF domain-containing protein-like [Aplysia californica]
MDVPSYNPTFTHDVQMEVSANRRHVFVSQSQVLKRGMTQLSFPVPLSVLRNHMNEVPVVCEVSDPIACCVTLNLRVSGAPSNLAVGTNCHYEMCGSHWDPRTQSATVEIPVIASRDDIDDGQQVVWINFWKLDPAGEGPYHQVWKDVPIPRVQVIVKDAVPGVCTVSGDPHVRAFERPDKYTFFDVGDYVLYQNPNEQVEVHGRTFPCGRNGQISCLCGVVVRDGDDMVEASMCESREGHDVSKRLQLRHPNDHHQHSPTRQRSSGLRLQVPVEGLLEGTKVYQSPRGDRVLIKLPSGASVSLYKPKLSLSMKLTVPPSHKGRGNNRGLCGTFDGNSTNDLMGSDDVIDTCKGSRCRPHAFVDSWKLQGNETLFNNRPKTSANALPLSQGGQQAPPNRQQTKERVYCGCYEGTSAQLSGALSNLTTAVPAIQCSGDADKPVEKTDCAETKLGEVLLGKKINYFPITITASKVNLPFHAIEVHCSV